MKQFRRYLRIATFALCAAMLFAVQSTAAADIGIENAKAIALKHAGVALQQVQFTKIEKEMDLIGAEYDIEFYADGAKYEYEIDANSGIVKESSKKIYQQQNVAIGTPSNEISPEQAKSIALAQVSGAKENNITKFKQDFKHGMPVYEIEIRQGFKEYEIKIDKASGKIIKFEVDD